MRAASSSGATREALRATGDAFLRPASWADRHAGSRPGAAWMPEGSTAARRRRDRHRRCRHPTATSSAIARKTIAVIDALGTAGSIRRLNRQGKAISGTHGVFDRHRSGRSGSSPVRRSRRPLTAGLTVAVRSAPGGRSSSDHLRRIPRHGVASWPGAHAAPRRSLPKVDHAR